MRTQSLGERTTRTHLVVLESGDEVIDGLRRFAIENGIDGAHFHAIGAFRAASLAFWDADRKEYGKIAIREQVEVLSLIGNIGRTESGEVKIHAHAAIGLRYGDARGGHVLEGTVHPTMEVFVMELGAMIDRIRDEKTGLDLIKPAPV